jgi:hypothetical protein
MPDERNMRASTVMSGAGTRPNVLPCAAVVRFFRPVSRIGAWLGRLVREDGVVGTIALAFALSELVTLGWDLPGSHGWENDGVAPRDLFGGLANNLTPGHAHRYPLLHYLVLAVPCLPVLLVAALSGPLSTEALRDRVLSVPTMTAVSVIAKLVATAMAAMALVVLARLVRRTFGARSGRFAALFAATNLTFAFYGRVSNLDVPYLFWTVLALDRLLDVAETGELRDHLAFAALAAASIATKDQAHASYILVFPLYVFVSLRGTGGDAQKRVFITFAKAALVAALAYGFASGALLNPTGFVKRLAELRGPASQDWRAYSQDLAGFVANVRAVFARQPADFWPLPMLGLAYMGVIVGLFSRAPDPSVRSSTLASGGKLAVLRPLSLVAGASNLVFFALLVGRAEHRFLLPFGFFLSAYGGVACDALLSRVPSGALQKALVCVLGAGFGWAAVKSFTVHLTQLGDARREVVRYLASLPRGSSVETYGLTVYQPHFDVSPGSPYRVSRVGPEPPAARNPLVGVAEVKGAIGDAPARRPDAIVLSEGFSNAYLEPKGRRGMPASAVVRARQRDRATASFVEQAARNGLPGYRRALVARAALPSWATAIGLRPVRIQSTTGSNVWVLVRTPTARATEPAPPTLPTTTVLR